MKNETRSAKPAQRRTSMVAVLSIDLFAMLKRPLNLRFSDAVREGRKFTTIRNKPWPVGVPIMLYNWSGPAYRSKQLDVSPVIVKGFWTIRITHKQCGAMAYECGKESDPALHESEGFTTQAEMDEWFRPLVKPGQTITKTLIRFRLANDPAQRMQPDSAQVLGVKTVC